MDALLLFFFSTMMIRVGRAQGQCQQDVWPRGGGEDGGHVWPGGEDGGPTARVAGGGRTVAQRHVWPWTVAHRCTINPTNSVSGNALSWCVRRVVRPGESNNNFMSMVEAAGESGPGPLVIPHGQAC